MELHLIASKHSCTGVRRGIEVLVGRLERLRIRIELRITALRRRRSAEVANLRESGGILGHRHAELPTAVEISIVAVVASVVSVARSSALRHIESRGLEIAIEHRSGSGASQRSDRQRIIIEARVGIAVAVGVNNWNIVGDRNVSYLHGVSIW